MRFVLLFIAFAPPMFLGLPRSALAASHAEAAAHVALSHAQNDYLSMNYTAGVARLQKALNACGPEKCSPSTHAALLRDMGTMQFREGENALAASAFAEAQKIHPTIDLNPNYDSPDLRAAWEAAKRGPAPAPPRGPSAPPLMPLAPPPSRAAPAGPPRPAPVAPAPLPVSPPPVLPQPAKGDFVHTPVPEQKIDTPLPVFISGAPADTYHVIVRYKSSKEPADAGWGHVDLTHTARGWEGLIPCDNVALGTMRYYIQGYDKDMDPVGAGGDAKAPYQVPIREALAGPPPHLPNKNPPKTCHASSTPGVEASGEGEEAEPAAKETSGSGVSEKAAVKTNAGDHESLRRWWIGVGLHFDFMQMPQGNDLCRLDPKTALPANQDHLYCYAPASGSDFPAHTLAGQSQNNELQPGTAGVSGGGIVLANLRFFASLDYALSANLLLGARLGFALLTYPGTQAVAEGYAFGSALYAEARITGVFGEDALAKAGFAPVAFGGGGVSAFDGHASGTATLCPAPSAACNGLRPTTVNVDVWRTNGPGFLDVGGGLRYAPAPRLGIIAALRLNLSLGNNGLIPTVGPELSGQMGF